MKLINGEQAFPIYKTEVKWIEDGYQDPKYPKWNEGLPEGRINNGTGFSTMYKEEMSQEELDKKVQEWWDAYSAEMKDKNIELIKLETTYVEHEVWYLTWFAHQTFDVGKSDEEVLKSFEDYVTRKQILNEKLERETGRSGTHCLMSAEDRWRWFGVADDGETHTAPPCRCKFCKEQGVIRIGH